MIDQNQMDRILVDQQLKNVAKLLNGKLIRKVFKDSSGNQWRAVIIEYPDPVGADEGRSGVRRDVRGQEDEIRPTEVDVNSRFEQGLCDWP